LHACGLDSQALGCAYSDKTWKILEQTMSWNRQHWQSNKEIQGKSRTFKQVGGVQDKHEQRITAHLKFLLMQCQLQLLHQKQCRQLLVD
jgi:hypothetical protein